MWRKTATDEVLVRYLLGELPEKERDRLEDRYFQDDALHERLLAAEAELIDAYVSGELEPKQRRRFEDRFLRSAERRKNVEFALALAARISETPPRAFPEAVSWWGTVLASFRAQAPVVRLALVAVALAVVLTPVVMVQPWRRAPAPGPPVTKDQKRGEAALPVLSLVLTSLQRSAGRQNTLVIPPGLYEIRIELELEGADYQRYRAMLQTAEGRQVQQLDDLQPETVSGRQVVRFSVTSDRLTAADYVIVLSGIHAAGMAEPAGGYAFRAVRSDRAESAVDPSMPTAPLGFEEGRGQTG